jgi:phenylalanyl-tRNA synthetase beta chain
LQKHDIEQDVFCAELDLELLTKVATREKKYSSLPKYPSVTRDVAFVVSKSVQAGDLETVIKRSGGVLLSRVDLFDIYEGNQISSDKKSVAFALEFLSLEHTLTQTEIDNVMQSIINTVSNKFDATIRK